MPRLSSSRSIAITTNYCVAAHGRDIQQLDMQEAVYTRIVSCLFRRKPNASYIGPVAIFEATHASDSEHRIDFSTRMHCSASHMSCVYAVINLLDCWPVS